MPFHPFSFHVIPNGVHFSYIYIFLWIKSCWFCFLRFRILYIYRCFIGSIKISDILLCNAICSLNDRNWHEAKCGGRDDSSIITKARDDLNAALQVLLPLQPDKEACANMTPWFSWMPIWFIVLEPMNRDKQAYNMRIHAMYIFHKKICMSSSLYNNSTIVIIIVYNGAIIQLEQLKLPFFCTVSSSS